MNVKIDFDTINVFEENNPNYVKVLMLKGEKGDKGDPGSIVNEYSTSTSDGYSANYFNQHALKVEDKNNMGNIVVDDIQGSNLLDKNYITPITSTGTTITQIENGINVKNTTSAGYGGSIKINVKENTDYYIQYDWTNVSNGINRVGVFTTNSQTIAQESDGNGFTFNSGSNTVVVIGFYAKNGGVAEVTYTNIKLSLGTNRKEYSTYKVFDNTAYILWTNPSPTASGGFASQSITLSDDIYNYKYYEVLFCYNTSTTSRVFSTGKIPVGMQSGIFMSTQYNYRRYVNFSSNAFTIADCVYYATYGTSTTTTTNTYLIPYQLIAYK